MDSLPQAENRATEAERTVSKLQKEVDRLEGMTFAPTHIFSVEGTDLGRIFVTISVTYFFSPFLLYVDAWVGG